MALDQDIAAILDQWLRIIGTLSPLLLLLFSSVRKVLAKLSSWAWSPITEQFAKRDTVLTQIRDSLSELQGQMQAMRDQSSVLVATMRARADADDQIGYFECDADGKNVYVSSQYAAWMGVSKAELIHWGFLNFTHEQDRDRVLREWASAREQHREYREIVRMGPVEGPHRPYKVVVQPIPDGPPALAWVGTLRPLRSEGMKRRQTDTDTFPAVPYGRETGV